MREFEQYADDPTIADECRLLRRIRHDFVVRDQNTGDDRISSQAFTDPSMSVHIGDDLNAAGIAAERILDKYPSMGLAAFEARLARRLDQVVCRDPVPEEHCHGIVAGRKSKSVARQLAHAATQAWIIRPRRDG